MKLTSFLPLLLTALPFTLTQPTSPAPASPPVYLPPGVNFDGICDTLWSLRPALIKLSSENNTSSDHHHHHHHQVADYINQELGCEDNQSSRVQLCDVVEEVFKTLGGGKEEKGKRIADKVLQTLKEVKGENLYTMLEDLFDCDPPL